MNVWKSFTLISAAAAALAGCGVRFPAETADSRPAKIESPASAAAPTQAAGEGMVVCRDSNAGQREIANLQAQQATGNYEHSKVDVEQAEIALNEIEEDLRSSQWQRDREESALLQARDRGLDATIRLNRDTQFARLGVLAESVVAESDEAMHSAEDLVSTIQSTIDSCANEISTLENQKRQAMAVLTDARQRMSETESALEVANAVLDRISTEAGCSPQQAAPYPAAPASRVFQK